MWKQRWIGGALAICGVVWLTLVAPAAADDPPDPEGYDALVTEAVREFDAGNFEEARSLFLRAHELFPNARTHRGLGFTEFELRNYGDCIKQLEAALTSDVKPLTERLRKDTEGVLARARNFVARVVLEAEPRPSRVLVDDVPVDVGEGGAVLLRVGEHMIELRAAGFAPERRRLSLKGGEEQVLRVVFSRPVDAGQEAMASAAPGPEGGVKADASPRKRWYRNPWLWTAVGVVVVGAAAGTAVALAPWGGNGSGSGGSSGQGVGGP